MLHVPVCTVHSVVNMLVRGEWVRETRAVIVA